MDLRRGAYAAFFAVFCAVGCNGQGSTLVQPVQSVYVPPDCDSKSEVGDHVMLRFSLKDASQPEAAPVFQMQTWEQRPFVLGAATTPKAFNSGLLNMCAGEQRLLTSDSSSFDVSPTEASRIPTMLSFVELVTLTTPADHAIFEPIAAGDIGSILDMVDGKAGINAVDQEGNSALMAAVQGGPKLHMAVATLLNAWRPKVDVNFAKPSGHTVLFYAVTQDDSKGSTILKALLQRGADPNAALKMPEVLGWTPLHFACKLAHEKHAALLLEYGADPLAESADGQSVLDVAKDAPYGVRKRLAGLLNQALARLESEEEAAALSDQPHSGGAGDAPKSEL